MIIMVSADSSIVDYRRAGYMDPVRAGFAAIVCLACLWHTIARLVAIWI